MAYRQYSQRQIIKLSDLVNLWKQRSTEEFDNAVGICGDEGDGKSCLATHIVKLFKDKGANLWDNVIYTPYESEFLAKFARVQEGSCLVFDESLDMLSSADFAKAESKRMVKTLRGRVRKEKNLTLVFLAQLFKDFHPYLRNHRIRYRLELYCREWMPDKTRNVAFLNIKKRRPYQTGKKTTWGETEQEAMWDKYAKKTTPGQFQHLMRCNDFYEGEFSFPVWTPEVKKEYLENRKRAFDEFSPDKPADDKPGKHYQIEHEKRMRLVDHLKEKGLMLMKEMADVMKEDASHLSKSLVKWREKKHVVDSV